jgi:hypothetical protein
MRPRSFLFRSAAFVASLAFGPASGLAARTPGWCPVPIDAAAAARPGLTAALGNAGEREPRAAVHVHTEHSLPGDPVREASLLAERDWPYMLENALAWRAGAGDSHLRTASRFLKSWADIYQPDFNPIDETLLDSLIETYAITRDRLDPPTRASAERLIRTLAEGYLTRMRAAEAARAPQSTWKNNWQSHRVKLATLSAAALGDRALLDQARHAFERQLAVNLRSDGSVIDFAQRDALHYVVYDLEPLLRAALAARAMNEDWYSAHAGRQGLADAVHWLEPFARGEKRHVEFAHSTVAFDAERAKAGVAGFSGEFDPKVAGDLFWLAASFEPLYAGLAHALAPRPPYYLVACGA